MGRYHDLDSVSRLLRTLGGRGVDLAAGKPIPSADVETFIAENEDRIDQRIRARYAVPVTDPVGLSLLGYVASRLTAAAVWRVLQANSVQGESGKANEWERQALSLLDQIADGTVALGDAAPATSDAPSAAGYDSGVPQSRTWLWECRQW